MRLRYRFNHYVAALLSFFLFFVCLINLANSAFADQPKMQEWSGTLDAGAAKLRLAFEITRTDDGNMTAIMVSKDQGNSRIPCDAVELKDGTLTVEVKKLNGRYEGQVNAERNAVDGTWTQNGNALPLKLTKGVAPEVKPIAVWKGTLKVAGQELVVQVRQMPGENGKEETLFDSPTQGAMGLKANMEVDGDQVTLKVPMVKGTFDGEMNEAKDTIVGTWSQGIKLPLTLKKVDKADKAATFKRPQHPQAPFPYRQETVVFKNETADVKLAGTLTLPQQPGKYPAVILVSGSGPQDRNEELLGHKPFLVIADYLTRRGVAVLRYDDRGVGESTGKAEGSSYKFAQDAAAGVTFLKQHDEVNSKRVGLVGHSEGGLIATIVQAELNADLAHFVMLAGPGVDGGKILRSQSEAMLKISGLTDEEIVEQMALTNAMVAGVRESESTSAMQAVIDGLVESKKKADADKADGEEDPEVYEVLRSQLEKMTSEWFRYFISYDPVTNLKKVQCPVLALNGEKDLQVLPDLNLPVIKRALEEGGNDDFRCVELPNLNHMFQEAETGSPSEYQSNTETFSPKALELLSEWIESH